MQFKNMIELKYIIKSLRISSYIKNSFVIAPLIFAKKLFEIKTVGEVLAGAFLFCMISSAVYLINDIRDIEFDRNHPRKKNRPIATGALPISTAILISILLSIFSLMGSFYLSRKFLLYIFLYFIMQLGYNFGLKHISIIESMIVASGFVIRVMAGSVLVKEPASEWIMLATFFLASVLIFGKRKSEYIRINNEEETIGRPVLQQYSALWLDLSLSISICAAIITYSLYCISNRGIFLGGKEMIYTLLPIMIGLLRYLQLISLGKTNEDIGQLLFNDTILLTSVLSWIIMLIIFIYII